MYMRLNITRNIKKAMWTNKVYADGVLEVLFHVSVESLSRQIWQYITCNVLLAVH